MSVICLYCQSVHVMYNGPVSLVIRVRTWRYGCLVTLFCYQMITKPGNKTALPSWPELYDQWWVLVFEVSVALQFWILHHALLWYIHVIDCSQLPVNTLVNSLRIIIQWGWHELITPSWLSSPDGAAGYCLLHCDGNCENFIKLYELSENPSLLAYRELWPSCYDHHGEHAVSMCDLCRSCWWVSIMIKSPW